MTPEKFKLAKEKTHQIKLCNATLTKFNHCGPNTLISLVDLIIMFPDFKKMVTTKKCELEKEFEEL